MYRIYYIHSLNKSGSTNFILASLTFHIFFFFFKYQNQHIYYKYYNLQTKIFYFARKITRTWSNAFYSSFTVFRALRLLRTAELDTLVQKRRVLFPVIRLFRYNCNAFTQLFPAIGSFEIIPKSIILLSKIYTPCKKL